ncbi:MAG: phospho-N-acetylmuramoyl-pentapeptide-transferase, partial [Actinomycetota bacterium]
MISILIAGAVAMFMSLAGTRFLMSYFRRLGKGQPILGAEDHGPVHQMGKQGTPTMGGIAILVSGLVGWTVAHVRDGLPFSDQAAIIWLAVFVL